ncbi:hypothetical protein [Mycolicibacterium lutetiense]
MWRYTPLPTLMYCAWLLTREACRSRADANAASIADTPAWLG